MSRPKLDLTSLHCFVHLSAVGNLTRAALDLGFAQPALTRRIKRLEMQLGVDLFQRLPRGMHVTPDGERFLAHCERVLREVSQAEQAFSANCSKREVLNFGVPGTCTAMLVPHLLDAFKQSMPSCELVVAEGITRRLKEDLLVGALDLAILNNPTSMRELCLLPLVTEDIVIVDIAGRAARYELDDLERIPFIATSGMREMVDAQLRPFGRRLNVSHDISSPEAIRRLLCAGQGPTIMPVSSFWPELKEGRLVASEIAEVRLTRILALAYRVDKPSADIPAAARVIQSAILELSRRGVFEAASVVDWRAPGNVSAPTSLGSIAAKDQAIAG